MRIIREIKRTSGQHHAWYETDKGFNVRKPLIQELNQELKEEIKAPERNYPLVKLKLSWWQWFKNLWKL